MLQSPPAPSFFPNSGARSTCRFVESRLNSRRLELLHQPRKPSPPPPWAPIPHGELSTGALQHRRMSSSPARLNLPPTRSTAQVSSRPPSLAHAHSFSLPLPSDRRRPFPPHHRPPNVAVGLLGASPAEVTTSRSLLVAWGFRFAGRRRLLGLSPPALPLPCSAFPPLLCSCCLCSALFYSQPKAAPSSVSPFCQMGPSGISCIAHPLLAK